MDKEIIKVLKKQRKKEGRKQIKIVQQIHIVLKIKQLKGQLKNEIEHISTEPGQQQL